MCEESMAEYEEMYWLCESLGQSDALTRDAIWTTKDGHKIAIKDMTNSHLLNTIRVLRGMSPINTTVKTSDERRRQWVNAMANEAYRRELQLDALTEQEPAHE